MQYLFVLFFLLKSQIVFAACNLEDTKVKMIIDRLKLEVVCASDSSMHKCRQLMDQFNSEDIAKKGSPSTIQLCESPNKLGPLAFPALAATNHLAVVLRQKPGLPSGVNSVEDFFEYTQNHRARVKDLGLELFRSYPEQFTDLNEKQVVAVLDAHDLEKVTATSKASDGRPFYRNLYDGYGKKIDRSVIDELNVTGKKCAIRF
jgi:hypothetical protein